MINSRTNYFDRYQSKTVEASYLYAVSGNDNELPMFGFGLIEEIGETLSTDSASTEGYLEFLEEAGDIMAYLSLLAYKLDCQLSSIINVQTFIIDIGDPESVQGVEEKLKSLAFEAASLLKRLFRGDSPDAIKAALEFVLSEIAHYLHLLIVCHFKGHTLYTVCDFNANKLESKIHELR